MSQELTFVPIAPDDFRNKMRILFHWNMEPITIVEALKTGDVLHCPSCGRMRYAMWKLVAKPVHMVYMGKYCTCPHKAVSP